MTHSSPTRMRQIMDWQAAVWAGCGSGSLFLLLAWLLRGPLIFHIFASPVLGGRVLLSETTAAVVIIGIITHLLLSVGFALLIAFVLHRWGMLVGIVGGGLLGLALYIINFYLVSALFPWFEALTSTSMLLLHVLYGAAAGGIYEALEVEEFVATSE